AREGNTGAALHDSYRFYRFDDRQSTSLRDTRFLRSLLGALDNALCLRCADSRQSAAASLLLHSFHYDYSRYGIAHIYKGKHADRSDADGDEHASAVNLPVGL